MGLPFCYDRVGIIIPGIVLVRAEVFDLKSHFSAHKIQKFVFEFKSGVIHRKIFPITLMPAVVSDVRCGATVLFQRFAPVVPAELSFVPPHTWMIFLV
jgi:hypothetical protein